ncbi:MraY family glycosyltransferase [Lancefieldella sp. Marseille-Q7238]|uniref:glycosyltransferase family 4 protein n=1 Tax=Lancefieldella sp. Marseille-Q7238 TaxID=3022127 RepID=UPI0024A99ECE|nr:MraY family glycosyltransferase [Lancefieldella sp. Marseille-Q7238]
MDLWLLLLGVFLVATLLSCIVTPFVRKLAWNLGIIDKPNRRRVNKKPVARMGGVALFVGLIGALVLYLIVLGKNGRFDKNVNVYLLGLAFVIIFTTGLVDDIISLKPLQKLSGQVLAACLAAAGGLVIGKVADPLSSGNFISLGWLTYPATVLYLVAWTNIINLIDGLDGLAAGVSCIASSTMFVLSMWAGRFDAAALSLAVAGSTLGFLVHNFYPATIFMGDSGALTLGFALGTISLLSVTRIAGLTTIIVPLVVAGIPIIDTFSAIVRRTRAHVSFATADRGHIHHRLIAAGYNQRQAVCVIYGWTGLLCIGSLIMTQVNALPRIAIFLMLLAMSAVFAKHLHLFEPVLLHHTDPGTGKDELITPADPDFEAEIEQLHEREHERVEELEEAAGIHHGDKSPKKQS